MIPTPKKVRVRIAVAVSPSGEWLAMGRDDVSDAQSIFDVKFNLNYRIKDSQYKVCSTCESHKMDVRFIEADIPIPESTTVEGRVG